MFDDNDRISVGWGCVGELGGRGACVMEGESGVDLVVVGVTQFALATPGRHVLGLNTMACVVCML